MIASVRAVAVVSPLLVHLGHQRRVGSAAEPSERLLHRSGEIEMEARVVWPLYPSGGSQRTYAASGRGD